MEKDSCYRSAQGVVRSSGWPSHEAVVLEHCTTSFFFFSSFFSFSLSLSLSFNSDLFFPAPSYFFIYTHAPASGFGRGAGGEGGVYRVRGGGSEGERGERDTQR